MLPDLLIALVFNYHCCSELVYYPYFNVVGKIYFFNLVSPFSFKILLLARHLPEIEQGKVPLTYPFWFDLDTFDRVTFPLVAGGIELGEDHTIESIYIASLTYFVRSQSRDELDRGAKWEDAFLTAVASVPLRHIAVARSSSLTLEMELEANTKSVVPYFSLNIGIMVGFCVLTCMMTDWVKSKPLLGLLGVISSVQACIAAFGFVMYWGMRFSGITLAVPFLMLGKCRKDRGCNH